MIVTDRARIARHLPLGDLRGNPDCSSAPNEGPYDPFDTSYQFGTNALIRSLQDNGIGPNAMQTPNTNVYGEVGSAINEVMGNTTAAQHFFGKLMLYLGTDYVVWGTDSVIYGSPARKELRGSGQAGLTRPGNPPKAVPAKLAGDPARQGRTREETATGTGT